MGVYNENRDKNNGMRDEIREQNAKLKNAPLKEKLSYFKEYYLKTTLIVIAVLIFLGSLLHTMITAPEDTAFSAVFFNDTGDSSDTSLADNFAEYAQIDTAKHEVYIDATLMYRDASNAADLGTSMNSYEAYVGLEKTMALITTSELDIIAGDKDAFDYFCKADCFHDVRTILPADVLSKLEDQLYYYTNEETGETLPVGIRINDAPKISAHHYYTGADAYLGFVVNSNSLDNALLFFDYIYME